MVSVDPLFESFGVSCSLETRSRNLGVNKARVNGERGLVRPRSVDGCRRMQILALNWARSLPPVGVGGGLTYREASVYGHLGRRNIVEELSQSRRSQGLHGKGGRVEVASRVTMAEVAAAAGVSIPTVSA